MEPVENPAETPLSQPPEVKQKRKTLGIVIAHRVLSSLAIAFGLLWVGIGLSLMQTSAPSPSPAFSSGPGSQQQIYYHSSERDKAPTYLAVGAIIAGIFGIGLFLKSGLAAYLYHTLLVILLIGLWGAGLILCIWWFRKRTRNYYGIG